MAQLELVSTDDLLEELYSRYDAAIFCGVADLGHHEEATHHGYAGGRVTAEGLCVDQLDWLKKQRPITGEVQVYDDGFEGPQVYDDGFEGPEDC